jgi:hypothetical protein
LVCLGELKACDDANECTEDSCSCVDTEPVCTASEVAAGTPCDDNTNDCTLGDSCLGGECVVGSLLPLDDGNPCTLDKCIKSEIVHEAILEGGCDDGNECTSGDTCYLGACVAGEVIQCVNPPCASDTICVQGQGCVSNWMPDGAVCDDGEPCTVNDTCNGDGECAPGEPSDCNDSNPCTSESCNPVSGECEYELLNHACDDGDGCTVADFCTNGVCVGQSLDCSYLDGNCSIGICLNGMCLIDQPVMLCDDGNENTCNDKCFEGECTGEECVFCEVDGDACDDGSPCTLFDSCLQGECIGTALDCTGLDGPCVAGICSEGMCVTEPTDGTCSDGDFYTCDDLCIQGECIGDPCEPEILGGETCADAVDMGTGGTLLFDLCDYGDTNPYDWCGNVGPEFYVKMKAQQNSAALDMQLLQSFPSLIVNYRFYKLFMCEEETEWYCYYNSPAGVSWGGYDPEDDVYISFGSTDGSCGVVEFSLGLQ